MTLYDVIGVDNIAIIVEAMQGTNLCHKSVWKDMGPSGDAVTLERVTTSRKVMGSIPECVIGIFRWHNPSGHTIAQGLTQPLTEMGTRNISWDVKAAGV